MQAFKRYFRNKMEDSEFKAYYEEQCHVCATTVAIFEKIEHEKLSMTRLARAVKIAPESLDALHDADYCAPRLVVRLCRHLGLQAPQDCPRRNKALFMNDK